jgi:nitrogen regulatory protein A
MKTNHAGIASSLERLRLETGSDFAGLGLIDQPLRILRWHAVAGSISERTLLVGQKLTVGLSGSAIRSGRPAQSSFIQSETERFRLGEPVLLGEQLRIAVAVPILGEADIRGVLLLGRREGDSYGEQELHYAAETAKEVAVEVSPTQLG